MTLAIAEVIGLPKKRKVLLPTLIVLFLVSYGLMSMLIVEQGRTIETQRGLIHELFNDSTELSALKTKEMLRNRIAQPLADKEKMQSSPAQAQPQAEPKHKGGAHTEKPAMQKPPKPSMDAADIRRISLAI